MKTVLEFAGERHELKPLPRRKPQATLKAPMAKPRKKHTRKELSRYPVRFGLHLRTLMEAKGWQTADLQAALDNQNVYVEKATIQKWLRGGGCPREDWLEPLGKSLGLSDYRHVLPPSQ